MALHRLRDPDLADEATQETMARAVAALNEGKADDIRNLGAFVHGIARHVISDLIRSRQRDAGPDALENAPDPASLRDALSRAVTADEHHRVRTALRRLSHDDQTILHMSFYDGLSPAEIAERFNEDSTRVRKRKSRALERLRNALAGVHSGHDVAPDATIAKRHADTLLPGPEMSA